MDSQAIRTYRKCTMTGSAGCSTRTLRHAFVRGLGSCLITVLALSAATCSSDSSEEVFAEVAATKPYEQLVSDLAQVTAAGYRKIGIFDLKGIGDTGNAAYFDLIRSYADQGVEIAVFVQGMKSSSAVELARKIGASSAIVRSTTLERELRNAGLKTVWWSLVAYPETAADLPFYMGWPDLRDDGVRSALAERAVDSPVTGGGRNLDYVRWNRTDQQRTNEQVTDLVRRIRAAGSRGGPLSADVYPYLGGGNGDGGARDVGQRWDLWLAEGLVDEVYPMAYLSADLPWLIPQWAPYGSRVVPVVSAVDTTR